MLPLFARRPPSSRRRGDVGGCQRLERRVFQFERLEDRRLLSAAPLGGFSDSDLLTVDVSTYETTRILVRFRDDQTAPQEGEILAGSHYGQSFGLISGLREVRLDGGVGVEDALARYRGHSSVLYAEPDYRVQLTAIPGDPRFNQLWGLHNTGQNGGTPDADIDAPEAWDLAAETGRTIVAVIDSGVDYTHPDLAANMWRNAGEIAGNGIDDDGNGFVDDVYGADFINQDGDPMDDHGHGTHVAGTIAAVHGNGLGVAGVNPNAEIMALKFLDASGSGSMLDAVAALDYAVAHGAQISNNSWGGSQFSQALEDAIRRARQAGHIVVAAAGNYGSNLDLVASYPASYDLDNVVSVAATDRNDLLAAFSNYGLGSVDLAAPGYAILSTTPNNTYDAFSGTSMAAPHVSGAISLVWDRNPDWDYARVIGQVLAAVDPLPGLAGKAAGGGRLNAAEALRSDTRGPQVLSSDPSGIVSGSVAGIAFTFNEPIDAATFTIADVAEFSGPDGELAATKVAVSGSTATVSFAAQTAPGLYRIVIGPDIDDLAGNAMDQDGDRLAGESGQDAFAAAFTLVDAVAFASADVPLPIQDNASIVSYLDIDEDITISDLDVWLDIDHTWDNDLRFYLVGPGDDLQDHVVLSSFRGGGGDGYRNTQFDDEATLSVAQATAPFTGSYRPEEPLAAFDGRSARGRWALVVQDAVAFDRGDLLGWSLIIQPEDDVSVDPAPGDAGQPNLVTGRATSVVAAGKDWTTVALDRTYRDPVVVATTNYGDLEGPAVVRIRNAQNASFDFQVVTPGGGAIDGVGVYYMVVEAGAYNETEHGIRMEAMKYVSDAVDRQGSWRGERRDYRNLYANPVVFGQVMTAADDWSVFWSRGDTLQEPPSSTALYLGRHVGEDLSAARAAETIGYIVFESGSGTLGGLRYEVGVGGDTVRGVVDGSASVYSHGITSPTAALVSQTGMDGLNGSWGLLYGDDPLGPNRLTVAVDEDQIRDEERTHITEQLAYIVFGAAESSSSPELRTAVATSAVTAGNAWTTVTLDREYRDMVVVATANYSSGDGPAVVRVRGAEGDAFEFQVATPGGGAIDGVDIHYLVVEAGVYNEAEHGIRMEAVKSNSTSVDRLGSWNGTQRTYLNSYSAPVVLGQVMTANGDWSAFWSRGNSYAVPPTSSSLYIGRHIGEDLLTLRPDETIGYLVIESGSGTLGGLAYEAGVGGDTVQGAVDNPPYLYGHGIASPLTAVVSQTGMDGLNGGWGVLYGANPLGANYLALAVDEDQIRDAERTHVTEQIAYVVFGQQPSPAAALPLLSSREASWLPPQTERDLALAMVVEELRRQSHEDAEASAWDESVFPWCDFGW